MDNVIGKERKSGYIRKGGLQNKVDSLWPGQGIRVRHINGRFEFTAPRLITDDELSDIVQETRVNAE